MTEQHQQSQPATPSTIQTDLEQQYYTLLDEYANALGDHYSKHAEFVNIVTQHVQLTSKIDNILDVLALLDRVDVSRDKERLKQLIEVRPDLTDKLVKVLNDEGDVSVEKVREVRALMERTPIDNMTWLQRLTGKLTEEARTHLPAPVVDQDNDKKRKLGA